MHSTQSTLYSDPPNLHTSIPSCKPLCILLYTTCPNSPYSSLKSLFRRRFLYPNFCPLPLLTPNFVPVLLLQTLRCLPFTQTLSLILLRQPRALVPFPRTLSYLTPNSVPSSLFNLPAHFYLSQTLLHLLPTPKPNVPSAEPLVQLVPSRPPPIFHHNVLKHFFINFSTSRPFFLHHQSFTQPPPLQSLPVSPLTDSPAHLEAGGVLVLGKPSLQSGQLKLRVEAGPHSGFLGSVLARHGLRGGGKRKRGGGEEWWRKGGYKK